jgi:lysophospholipase L1-like esterase
MSRSATLPLEGVARQREVRWVALGDSFTAGTDSGEREGTWASLVRERLAATSPTALLNLAEAGARIDRIEAQQLPVAVSSKPDLVTVICGGNDVINTVRPLPDALALDIDYIFERVATAIPDARVLTATYPPIASHALRPRTRRRVEDGMAALNSVIRNAAPRHGIACVELCDHPGQSDASNYADDGIHPSCAGHLAAADVLEPAIRNLMKTIPTEGR